MARNLGSKPQPGDNSAGMIDGVAARRFIDRAKKLLDQRDDIGQGLKEVYAEAKQAGFVTARLRHRVKEERMDPEVLAVQKQYDEALRLALGEFSNTPLGEAAIADAHPQEKAKRKPRSQTAIEAAQAHLDAGGDFEPIGAA